MASRTRCSALLISLCWLWEWSAWPAVLGHARECLKFFLEFGSLGGRRRLSSPTAGAGHDPRPSVPSLPYIDGIKQPFKNQADKMDASRPHESG